MQAIEDDHLLMNRLVRWKERDILQRKWEESSFTQICRDRVPPKCRLLLDSLLWHNRWQRFRSLRRTENELLSLAILIIVFVWKEIEVDTSKWKNDLYRYSCKTRSSSSSSSSSNSSKFFFSNCSAKKRILFFANDSIRYLFFFTSTYF